MTPNEAETVALSALAWLAADADLLSVFMGATGIGEAELRARAADPELLAAVLDFIVMDDAWAQGFATAAGLAPQAPLAARQALPGGALPHWT